MDTKHPLATWMDGQPLNQAQLAEASGCSEPHLSLILQRKRGVSMKLAQRLSRATGGAVSVEDFLLDDTAGAQ